MTVEDAGYLFGLLGRLSAAVAFTCYNPIVGAIFMAAWAFIWVTAYDWEHNRQSKRLKK